MKGTGKMSMSNAPVSADLSVEEIRNAYRYIMGRLPSEKELALWLEKSVTLEQLRSGFLGSKEFQKLYEKTKVDPKWSPTAGQIIINIRIPKTAGTSLTKIIGSALQSEHVILTDEINLSNVKQLGAAERLKIQMVAGHIVYGLGSFFQQRVLYITMLRAPAERVYSFFRYVSRMTDHPLNSLIGAAT